MLAPSMAIVPGAAGKPSVIQPSLSLDAIRWGDRGGLMTVGEFVQEFKSSTDGGSDDLRGLLNLRITSYRPKYRARGMDSPLVARAVLRGSVEGAHEFSFIWIPEQDA